MRACNVAQDPIIASEARAARQARKKRLKREARANESMATGLLKERFARLVEEDGGAKEATFRRLVADMERRVAPARKLKGSPRRRRRISKYKRSQKPAF